MPRKKKYKPKEVQFYDSDSNDSSSDASYHEADETFKYHDVDFRSDEEKEEVLSVVDDEESEVSDEKETSEDDVEAWGKKKSVYFNADFIDEDRGRSYRGEDKETAKAEELDALKLQRKFLDGIHTTAFETESYSVMHPISGGDCINTVTEWQLTSRKEGHKVVNKTTPEFIPALCKFKRKLVELQQQIPQILHQVKAKSLEENELLKLKSQLLLLYSMNMSFYIGVKSMNKSALYPAVLEKVKLLENILNQVEHLEVKCSSESELLKTNFKRSNMKAMRLATSGQDETVGLGNGISRHESENDIAMEEPADNVQSEKRSVPYKITKNKGLTPHRKKEYRNPRVRHRMKYKKALIRRKGQVRTPRTEIERYGGERTGIHANVTKSIKFK